MAKAPTQSSNSVLIGTGARDKLDGEGGDDRLEGRGGDDKLEGGTGSDTLDGGSGDDTVKGEDGNDRLIYTAGENRDSSDDYSGGAGQDTLVLQLTRAEWMSVYFQYDLYRLNGGAIPGSFSFYGFNLTASSIETLEIYVDGVAMSQRDDAVVLAADTMAASEEAAGAAVNLLANDQVADLVRSVSHTQAAHGSVRIVDTDLADPVAAASASVVYTPDGAYWQYLAAGQTATDSFTYTVTDADYDTRTATVVVTVIGVNDAPVLLDAAAQGLAGSVRFRDVDLTDTHTVDVASAGGLGTFSARVDETPGDADNTGRIAWTFTPAPAAFNALAQGQMGIQTATLTLSDSSGAAFSTQVSVTLIGVNEAPVILDAQSAGLTGSIRFQDADLTDRHQVAVSGGGGLGVLGPITVVEITTDTDDTGRLDWSFTPDPAAFAALAQDQTATQTYTVTVTDPFEGAASMQLTVVVTGRNDAPELVDSTNDGLAGTVRFRDADLTDRHTVAVDGAGALGTLSAEVVEATDDAADTGSIVWSFTPDPLKLAQLGEGETANETYTLTLRDPSGAIMTTQVVVTLTGVNDAPVARPDAEVVTQQNRAVTLNPADLLLNDTDPDGDTLTIVSVGQGFNGTVEMTSTGLLFTPAANFTGEASFLYTVSDGNGGTTVATALVRVELPAVTPVLGDQTWGDVMEGTAAGDNFWGRGGGDVLYGRGGADTLVGGHDSDYVDGGEGDDVIGEAGQDYGDDVVRGGLGNDRILEGSGADTYLYARGDGNDKIADVDSDGLPTDVLILENIASTDVILRASGTSLLVVIKAGYGHDEQVIELLHQLDPNHPSWGVEEIRFSDNVVWHDEQFLTLLGASSGAAGSASADPFGLA